MEFLVTQAISIPLDPATATAYESVSDRERRQLQLLLRLRLRLRELTEQPPRPLADVLDEAARAAATRGLTGDILRDLLTDTFLELAAAGRATHVVSGDADLLELHPFRTVRIVTPAEFLREPDPR
jgi:predicted nucleic acid-binding protein